MSGPTPVSAHRPYSQRRGDSVQSRLFVCLSVCPRSKKKTAWAIDTKVCTLILYRSRSARIDPEVKRSKVKVTRLRKPSQSQKSITVQTHTKNEQVRQWGLAYIHTCRRPHAAPYSTNAAPLAWRLWCAFPYENLLRGGWPIRPILGFRGSKVPQNGRFPAQDALEPPCKIWRR